MTPIIIHRSLGETSLDFGEAESFPGVNIGTLEKEERSTGFSGPENGFEEAAGIPDGLGSSETKPPADLSVERSPAIVLTVDSPPLTGEPADSGIRGPSGAGVGETNGEVGGVVVGGIIGGRDGIGGVGCVGDTGGIGT